MGEYRKNMGESVFGKAIIAAGFLRARKSVSPLERPG